MKVYVVSAELANFGWRAIKAFVSEERSDAFAEDIYEKQWWNDIYVFDSRVDEVNIMED